MSFVKVVLSCKLFNNFSRTVHLGQYDSMKSVCNYMKRQLVAVLELENMCGLAKEAEELHLHCDSFKFYTDLCESGADIVYLCDHECERDDAGRGHTCNDATASAQSCERGAPRRNGEVPDKLQMARGVIHLIQSLYREIILNDGAEAQSNRCVMDMLICESDSVCDRRVHDSKFNELSPQRIHDMDVYRLLTCWREYMRGCSPGYLDGYTSHRVLRILMTVENHPGIMQLQNDLYEDVQLFSSQRPHEMLVFDKTALADLAAMVVVPGEYGA